MPTKKKNKQNFSPRADVPPMMFNYLHSYDPDNWSGKDPLSKLPTEIREVIKRMIDLFSNKNAEYQSKEKWNANFLDSPPVAQDLMTPLVYCMTLASKQDDAFWKAIKRNRNEYHNIIERLMDGAVYRVIALGIIAEQLGYDLFPRR